MVEVGALVRDGNGRTVSGLAAEDFRLFDGGREEVTRNFSAGGAGKRESGAPSAFKDEARGRSELLCFLRELEPLGPVALLSLRRGRG